MLPRFRPATLGLTATARPSIRPVKMTAVPPVPSPPRRRESGFGTRVANDDAIEELEVDSLEAITEDHHEQATVLAAERYAELDAEREIPTAAGQHTITGQASTLNRGPVTIPREELNPRGRANVMQAQLRYDDETQLRAVDDHVLENLRREGQVILPPVADLGVDYESLPSLEIRPVYDTYGQFDEEQEEPTTQAALESPLSPPIPREEGSYERMRERAPSYDIEQDLPTQYPDPEAKVIAEDAIDENGRWAQGDDSGPRPRPNGSYAYMNAPQMYAAPVPSYDEDSAPPSMPWGDPPPPVQAAPRIPPAPRVPEEMRSNRAMSSEPPPFVMGVQPLRTPTPDAWGTPHAMPAQGQGYVPMQQTLQPMQTPYMMVPPQQQPMMMAPQMMMAAPQAYLAPQYAPPYAPQAPQYAPPYARSAPVTSPSSNVPAQPSTNRHRSVGAQLSPSMSVRAATTSKYSWFGAGTAFGAAVMLCALAVYGVRFAGAEPAAPAAHPPTTQAQAPAPTQAPTANAPGAPASTTTALPTTAQPAALPPTVGVATNASNLPNAPRNAAPPHTVTAPRVTSRPAPPPRRPSAPSGPRALPGSGETDAPPAAAPPPSSGGSDLGDLLGAGLKP